MSDRTLVFFFAAVILFAAGGYWLLNDLFLSAYRMPGHIPAVVYGAEMAQDVEVLQDMLESGVVPAPVPVRRIEEHYRKRADAIGELMDPMLKGRLNGYHESVWPLVEKWAAEGSLAEAERTQLHTDMAALRKIVVLAGQRIERTVLDERRASLLLTARVAAALFGLLTLGALVALFAARRAGRRRGIAAAAGAAVPEVGAPAVPDEETRRELARERMLVRRYRAMLDSLPAAVVAADAVSGQVLFANAAFRSWFGVEGDFIGEPAAAVAARAGVAFTEAGKLSLDGRTYWREPVRIGETDLYLLRDISEQERLANRLVNSERLISIGEMASKVTHEIRNPLSTVKMNIEYLADHARDLKPEELATAIERIVREVARLEEITGRYMGMVRYRADGETAQRALLPDAVEDIAKFHAGEFSRRSIALEVGPLPRAEVTLSLNSFREVMLNLLKNAWEELGTGGTVRVRAEEEDRMARVIVEDSGRGVPVAERAKIFRNFYTTKPGGTGIGLSHSLKLVTEVGGTIMVDDSPLGGARFSVTLPLVGADLQG